MIHAMKKFSVGDVAELEVLTDAFAETNAKLEQFRPEFLEKLTKLIQDYNVLIEEQNFNIAQFGDFIDGRIEDIDNYTSERSDKWQDGEMAERYSKWRDELDGARLDKLYPYPVPDIEAGTVTFDSEPLMTELPDD